jgi:hypothetical protein
MGAEAVGFGAFSLENEMVLEEGLYTKTLLQGIVMKLPVSVRNKKVFSRKLKGALGNIPQITPNMLTNICRSDYSSNDILSDSFNIPVKKSFKKR